MDENRRKRQGEKPSIKKRPAAREIFRELGKVPPQAVELEEVVLGALMLEANSEKCKEVLHYIKPEIFYRTEHQLIAQAILDLKDKESAIDITLVYEQLKKNGTISEILEGVSYLTKLINRVNSSENIIFHFRILYQKFVAREIIRIGNEMTKEGYEETNDVFDMIDKYIGDLEDHKITKVLNTVDHASDVADQFENDMEGVKKDDEKFHPYNIMFGTWETGHHRFDEIVTLGRDKLILLAGGAKHAKTKFVSHLIFRLVEKYIKEIAVYWVTLEDSKYDLLRSYIASKIMLKPKSIRLKKYPVKVGPVIKKWLNVFKKFDIEFRDHSITSEEAAVHFKRFCDNRPGKFCIMVFDNVMAAGDRAFYRHDLNAMYDFIMSKMSEARQKTKQMVIVLHHYNDAQQNEKGIETGYRPRLTDIKGTEAFRRVPTQVLLVNYFKKYKDLLAEYEGEQRELLNYIYVVDAGANREDDDDDEVALIHFFINADFTLFEEIHYPEKEKEREKAKEDNEINNPI